MQIIWIKNIHLNIKDFLKSSFESFPFDGFSQEFEWQQVSSSLQNSS